MKAEERRKRLEQIEAYAKSMVQGIRVMDERRHILQPLLRNESIRKALRDKFDGTLGAHAYFHLAPMIAQDLVRDLARLFLDEGKRAGSFVNLYRKASERNIHKELRKKFSHLPDKWNDEEETISGLSQEESNAIRDKWRENDREDFAKSFDEGWEIATRSFRGLESDSVAVSIKTFRDKYHAHLEMAPLGNDPGPFDVKTLGLKYDDILDFADRYMRPAYELSRILTGNIHDVDGFSHTHQQCGEDMWRVFAGMNECSDEK